MTARTVRTGAIVLAAGLAVAAALWGFGVARHHAPGGMQVTAQHGSMD